MNQYEICTHIRAAIVNCAAQCVAYSGSWKFAKEFAK